MKPVVLGAGHVPELCEFGLGLVLHQLFVSVIFDMGHNSGDGGLTVDERQG
jgi:hypothetical protein